jgi:hypothetical protein
MIGKPPSEQAIEMLEAGVVSRTASAMSGRKTHLSYIAASEQGVQNKNKKRERCKTIEAACTPGDR